MGATSRGCYQHARLIILSKAGLSLQNISLQNTHRSSLSVSLQSLLLPTSRCSIRIISSLLLSHDLSAAHNLWLSAAVD